MSLLMDALNKAQQAKKDQQKGVAKTTSPSSTDKPVSPSAKFQRKRKPNTGSNQGKQSLLNIIARKPNQTTTENTTNKDSAPVLPQKQKEVSPTQPQTRSNAPEKTAPLTIEEN